MLSLPRHHPEDDRRRIGSVHLAERRRGPDQLGRQQRKLHQLPHKTSFLCNGSQKAPGLRAMHLGPDHPQIEIFTESKHGDIYDAFGDEYNWTAAPGTWTPGVDFRGPTCASCHMSGAGSVMTSHDVTERLSWELQAPLTVRPENFKPLPAQTNWKEERTKMQEVCMQCHGKR